VNLERPRGDEVILLVDDEIELLKVSARLLGTLGYTVHKANGGQEALDFLSAGHADLVVLDMVMPHMDGVETLRNIRKMKPEQKVVILSAFAEPDRIAQVKELGVYAYIQKPFAVDNMARTLRNALDGIADETL
jgi:CheY-like chemotaxis protein